MDAKRDAEFEAEISVFEDHNADLPDPILSTQINSTIQMAKSALHPCPSTPQPHVYPFGTIKGSFKTPYLPPPLH